MTRGKGVASTLPALLFPALRSRSARLAASDGPLAQTEAFAKATMDLKGQKVCESVCFHLIVAATLVAFAGGLYLQSIRYVLDSPEEPSLAHPIRY